MKNKMVTRNFPVRNSTYDEETGIVKGVLTTEEPAMVIDWSKWEVVREVLLMSGAEIPEIKQVPLLDSHDSRTTKNIVGSIRNIELEDKQIVGDVVLSSTAEAEKTKIKEGHITDLSVGYAVDEKSSQYLKKGESVKIGDTEYKNEYEDGMLLVIRTAWRLLETSLVAIGADPKAKLRELQVLEVTPKEEEKTKIEIKTEAKNKMTDEEKKLQEIEQIQKFANERFEGRYKPTAEQAIREGKSFNEFTKIVFDEIQKKSGDYEKPKSAVGLTETEKRNYSFQNAINGLMNNQRSGFEFEIHQELEKKGLVARNQGILVPYEMQRTQTVGSASGGGNLVATTLRGDMLIDQLVNPPVLQQLGATFLTGLRDNISIPYIVSGHTGEVVAEGSAATGSDIVFGQKSASPKLVSANTSFTKKLLSQSSVSVEALVQRKITQAINILIDYLGLRGSGATNNPRGLLNTSGVNSSTMTTPTWAGIQAFIRDLLIANAIGNFKWLMSPQVRHALVTTPKVSGQAIFLQENEMVAGYSALATNQVASQTLVLGAWEELYMMFWGAQEIVVDPYTESKKGIVNVTIFDEMDVLVAQPTAFTINTGVTISE